MQNKKPLKIILYVGRVTSLQSWVAKKSCHGQTRINEYSISDYPSNFEGLSTHPTCNIVSNGFLFHIPQEFSFLIKKSRQKAIKIEIASFHSLENPKCRTLDHFFYASHMRQNFPYKLIPVLMS